MVKEKEKNIFDCSYQKTIVHQCNCVTRSSHARGFAEKVFRRYEWADAYLYRTTSDSPGSIRVDHPTLTTRHPRHVIALFAQYYPGKPKYRNDTETMRLDWFSFALLKIASLKGSDRPTALAFPKFIGCGLAGGDWIKYRAAIEKFETLWKIPCTIYHWEGEEEEVEVLEGTRRDRNRTYVGKTIEKKLDHRISKTQYNIKRK